MAALTIDPVLRALLDEQAAANPPSTPGASRNEARSSYARRWAPYQGVPAVMEVRDIALVGSAGSLDACLYRPEADTAGTIVFLHGGGWMLGSPGTHDALARQLAVAAGASVLSVDYRLAPEHAYPAQVDDALVALAAVGTSVLPGWAEGPVAIAADSAGAAVALSAMLRLRSTGKSLPVGAAFLYGAFAPNFETGSHARLGDGSFGLTTARMRGFWTGYLGFDPDAIDRSADQTATPGWADLAGLPPVHLNAGALDVLLDDSVLLAARLAAAGVAVELTVTPGAVHGYAQFAGQLPIAARAIDAAGAFLRVRLEEASAWTG